jgi:hypothetical protein
MPHELISLLDTATLPVAFSSRMRGDPRGRILVSQEYYVVFEHRPLTVMQMAKAVTEKTIPSIPLEYLYVASVFYRKSRNPHGPSRPADLCLLPGVHRAHLRHEAPGVLG